MKQRLRKMVSFMILWGLVLSMHVGAAAGKILFIPHDDRPISYHQTVEVLREAGYDMILPPQEHSGIPLLSRI